jgi:hypothetical protein
VEAYTLADEAEQWHIQRPYPDDPLLYDSRLLQISQLTGALRMVVRTFTTFTTHYDLTDVDLPCLVYDGGGSHLSKRRGTMIYPMTRTTHHFMILALNLRDL